MNRRDRRERIFRDAADRQRFVDGSGSGYRKSVGDYVHLNPARAKRVAVDAPLQSFA